MNYVLYFVTTCVLYFTQCLGAVMIEDIGLIFEFVSAISISCIAFIFPGVFYVIAERKYASTGQREENKGTRMQAWGFIVLGLIAFVV